MTEEVPTNNIRVASWILQSTEDVYDTVTSSANNVVIWHGGDRPHGYRGMRDYLYAVSICVTGFQVTTV